MTDHIRSLSRASRASRSRCVPNAGLPDEERPLPRNAGDAGRACSSAFAEQGWLNVIGGCCGTTPGAHPGLRRGWPKALKPRAHADQRARHVVSGIDYLEITDDMRPVIVGERTNVIGSRKFKRADRRRASAKRPRRSPARR